MNKQTDFHGLINALNTAQERVRELEDMPTETPQTEMQSEKKNGRNTTELPELWDNSDRCGAPTRHGQAPT